MEDCAGSDRSAKGSQLLYDSELVDGKSEIDVRTVQHLLCVVRRRSGGVAGLGVFRVVGGGWWWFIVGRVKCAFWCCVGVCGGMLCVIVVVVVLCMFVFVCVVV